MSGRDFIIEAAIHPREQGAVKAAARQLLECLRSADPGQSWRASLRFSGAPAAQNAAPAASATFLSLMPFVEDATLSIERVQSRLGQQLERAAARGVPAYLLNLFRYVADRGRDGSISPLHERILRLNRMAISLSQETGVAVADIDRACADAGARLLGCDWSLSSLPACEVAGGAVVSCMLTSGLDEVLPPETQERAKSIHASAYGKGAALARRIIETGKPIEGRVA